MNRLLPYRLFTHRSRHFLEFTVLLLTFVWMSTNPALANGSRDRTFGNGGIARIAFDPAYPSVDPRGVVVRPDGKIIVVGMIRVSATPNTSRVAIAQLNSDGTLDSTFGSGGKVVMRPLNKDTSIFSIALQPDGKFVIAGNTFSYVGDTAYHEDILSIRFNVDGSLDSTFGTGGIVTTNVQQNDVQSNLKIQNDGKIVISGYTYSVSTPSGYTHVSLIARYNQNGSLDTTFGSNGIVQLSAFNEFVALAIQTDGKVVAAAYTYPILQTGTYLLARFLSNGSLDNSFGNNGVSTTQVSNAGSSGYGSGINDIGLQPDGKIVAAGYPLIRYLTDGSIDPDFAVPFNNQLGYYIDSARGYGGDHISLRSDGKIVVTNPNSIASYNDVAGLVGKDGGLIGITLRPDSGLNYTGRVAVQQDDKLLLYGASQFNPDPAGPAFIVVRYQTITSLSTKLSNFRGSGVTNMAVFRPSTGTWYARDAYLEIFQGIQFGTEGDYVCPADYDGDGSSDLVIWRTPTGGGQAYFCHQLSFPSYSSCTPWGLAGDVPVVGDYDGDTLNDMTVFRQGVWHILRSVDGAHQTIQWGIAGDKPVTGDYDGDGVTDVAIFRPSNGTWHVRLSSTGSDLSRQFGLGSDKLVPGDYDGDGKTDFAVFRDGTWYIQQSSEGFRQQQFGLGTDRPVPGDYDGDGLTDISVYRNGTWYLLQSFDGLRVEHWGQAGDIPLSIGFVNQ